MIEIAVALLKKFWPFLLLGAVLGVEEIRIAGLKVSLATSQKRETVLQSNLDAAKQRATDLALLYAGMLPKIDEAARAQEKADHDRILTLQQRVAELSHAPDLRFGPAAVRVWSDASAVANGGDAAAPAAPAGGADPVPATAERVFSEADVIG